VLPNTWGFIAPIPNPVLGEIAKALATHEVIVSGTLVDTSASPVELNKEMKRRLTLAWRRLNGYQCESYCVTQSYTYYKISNI
jgi:membrane protease subunit (stomatin/prohibitin family)